MDKIQIARKALGLVVGISVGYVTGSILKNTVTADSPLQKVQAQIGGYVIGAMVSGVAVNWADEQVSSLLTKLKKNAPENTEIV